MKKINFKPETSIAIAALLLRCSAALMAVHGWKKLADFSEKVTGFPDPLHIGNSASLSLTIFAEFFCTIFIAAGLFTRLAVIPPIICMLVIIFMVDSGQAWMESELAILYCFIYFALFFTGAGKYSVDNLINRK